MSYKSNTNFVLVSDCKVHGIQHTLNLATAMLQSTAHKGDEEFRTILHGEICETILELGFQVYQEQHRKETAGWFWEKGLILKDPASTNSRYLTELDLALFTPQMVHVFECKSYGGKKVLSGKCTLQTANRTCDVYRQNAAHEETLLKNINAFRLPGEAAYKAAGTRKVLFSFALGELEDTRTDKDKKEMPCLTYSTLFPYLDASARGGMVWNTAALKKAMDVIERAGASLEKKHLEYVKSIKR